jgi:site-specific recombinase XerD
MARDISAFNLVREEYAGNSLQRAISRKRLTAKDAELIRAFTSELQATDGISVSRANKITYTLVGWRRFLIKPFNTCLIPDIHSAIPALKAGKSVLGRPYKANTISDFLKILKQFFTWMIKNKHSKIPIDKIQDLRAPGRDPMTTTAGDLLAPDEVEQMIYSCKRDVDRAMLWTLYEGAFRIGEIGLMKWGDLTFDSHGVIVNVSFKTDKPRYVRLIMAKEHLARWRASYPGKAEGDALVFLNREKGPLTHAQVRKQIRVLADRAGIQKRVNPHVFRHSRITHLIREGAAESVVKAVCWGSQDSRMLRTYLHLTGQDIDSEMLKLYGIETPKRKTERGLKPVQCPHCKIVNGPNSTFCNSCGRSLTQEASDEEEEVRQFMMDPGKLRRLADKIEKEKKGI